MVSPDNPATHHNYDELVGTGASLMLAMLLIDSLHENRKDAPPPVMREFDLGGGLTFDDHKALSEGGEINLQPPVCSPIHRKFCC